MLSRDPQDSTFWIQIILIAAIAVVAALLTRSTAGARHQAIRRLLLLGFVAAAVLAVMFPAFLTMLAQAVGVGRGTDLLLYALVIAFVSYIATSHRRANALARKITLLTRELGLSEARAAAVDQAPTDGPDRAGPAADGSGSAAGTAP